MFSHFALTILDWGLAFRGPCVSAAETQSTQSTWSGGWWFVTQQGVTVLFAICYKMQSTLIPSTLWQGRINMMALKNFGLIFVLLDQPSIWKRTPNVKPTPGMKPMRYLVQSIYCHPDSFETRDPITEPDPSEKQHRWGRYGRWHGCAWDTASLWWGHVPFTWGWKGGRGRTQQGDTP